MGFMMGDASDFTFLRAEARSSQVFAGTSFRVDGYSKHNCSSNQEINTINYSVQLNTKYPNIDNACKIIKSQVWEKHTQALTQCVRMNQLIFNF